MNKKIKFGISGSDFVIFDDKITKKSYNIERFKKQIEKQYNFKESYCFKKPEIFSYNYYDNYLECSMKYIDGIDCINFFYLANKSVLDQTINNIILLIEENINKSSYAFVNKNIFINKINSINIDNFYKQEIINYISNIEDESFFLPIGQCHGDLTFTNMIFHGKDIYLIDFLDSFLETPFQDIVKIRQDAKYFWSIFEHKQKNIENLNYSKIATCYTYMDKIFDLHFSKYFWYKKYYNLMQIVNLSRILPYNNDKKIKNYLETTILELMRS